MEVGLGLQKVDKWKEAIDEDRMVMREQLAHEIRLNQKEKKIKIQLTIKCGWDQNERQKR